MSDHPVEIVARPPRRRNYAPEERLRLVAAAFRPGVATAKAARALGVSKSQLYHWRRLALEQAGPGFAAVTIAPEPTAAPRPLAAAPASGVMEIDLPGGARVRLLGGVDPGLASAILSALAASGRTP